MDNDTRYRHKPDYSELRSFIDSKGIIPPTCRFYHPGESSGYCIFFKKISISGKLIYPSGAMGDKMDPNPDQILYCVASFGDSNKTPVNQLLCNQYEIDNFAT